MRDNYLFLYILSYGKYDIIFINMTYYGEWFNKNITIAIVAACKK
jgi:hypothetical protein